MWYAKERHYAFSKAAHQGSRRHSAAAANTMDLERLAGKQSKRVLEELYFPVF
jgi:hypothetical protein